jgi:hypothetical protein
VTRAWEEEALQAGAGGGGRGVGWGGGAVAAVGGRWWPQLKKLCALFTPPPALTPLVFFPTKMVPEGQYFSYP